MSAVILLSALATPLAFTHESDHDRWVRKQLEGLDVELREAVNAPDREARIADIQKRMAELDRAKFDLTLGQSNVCPVHNTRMTAMEMPIAYGMQMSNPDPKPANRARQFPFAPQKIIGGCIIPRNPPKAGKVFVCPKCVEAEKAWRTAHKE